jgi:hypothetical protein
LLILLHKISPSNYTAQFDADLSRASSFPTRFAVLPARALIHSYMNYDSVMRAMALHNIEHLFCTRATMVHIIYTVTYIMQCTATVSARELPPTPRYLAAYENPLFSAIFW